MNFSDIEFPKKLFITGIGTDVGKSFATGWLAKEMRRSGLDAITQKMIQTGNQDMSEDILRHREIMGIGLQPADLEHLTSPVILSYPASPHLAAEIDHTEIDLDKIADATEELSRRFSHVVIEGAGGLMVPLKGEYLTADYLRDRQIPTMVTINGQLGSINHVLLTLHAIKSYGIPLFGVIYNPYFDKDEVICADTRKYLDAWLKRHFPEAVWLDMPEDL